MDVPLTVRVTVFDPVVLYVTDTGPAEVDVPGEAPEPKFHDQEVTLQDEASVNTTGLFWTTVVIFAVKPAFTVFTAIKLVLVRELLPCALVAVRVTE